MGVKHNGDTWLCPLCYKECKYGTNGCNDPFTCDEPKNIVGRNRLKRGKVSKGNVVSIGIAEIANKEMENE